MNDKVISLLGLAERAGKIASGEFAAEKAVKTGKARLIIVHRLQFLTAVLRKQ